MFPAMKAQNMILSKFPTFARNSAATKISDAAKVRYRIQPSFYRSISGISQITKYSTIVRQPAQQ